MSQQKREMLYRRVEAENKNNEKNIDHCRGTPIVIGMLYNFQKF
jgi:hypothetical protein